MSLYSISKKVFLSFLMIAVGMAQAVCVSISRYEASNGRTIYLFGDMHISSRELSLQEQEEFIAVAKKKKAVCIVEDMFSYEGDNQAIQQMLDNASYAALFKEDDSIIKYPESPLQGLAHKCLINGISCLNAECRHTLNLLVGNEEDAVLEKICEEFDKVVENEKEYNDGELSNYYKEIVSAFAPYKGIGSEITYKIGKKSHQQMFNTDGLNLLNVRILHYVHKLLQNENDKRDIFIFAGSMHTQNIELPLKYFFKVRKKKEIKSASNAEILCNTPLWESFDGTHLVWDKQVGLEFINKFKVNITEFFK